MSDSEVSVKIAIIEASINRLEQYRIDYDSELYKDITQKIKSEKEKLQEYKNKFPENFI